MLLDFTGMNAGTLSYDFATAFNSTGNRNGSMRVYTSTDGTTFTELAAASVLDFQNNVAFSRAITLVALPASFTNCATARIRFYEYNGTGPAGSSGARPKASIDNVVVTATPISSGGPSGPVISNFSTIPASPLDTTAVTVQCSVVDTAQQAAAIDALADVALPSWAQAHLGVDVTEANIAAARLWVDYDTLRRRLAAGYNSAAALVDAGLAAGALPAWADVVAVIEAA